MPLCLVVITLSALVTCRCMLGNVIKQHIRNKAVHYILLNKGRYGEKQIKFLGFTTSYIFYSEILNHFRSSSRVARR